MIWMRLVGRGVVGRGDVNRAVVLDVDLDAGLLDDAADHLAARSDQVADLIGRNLQGVDARRVLATSSLRGVGDRRVHLVENVAGGPGAPAPALPS